jgi:hypothetical protein
MEQIAAYIAPAATMIAAMMTAANISARVTGWGFVVFTVGSVCWSVIGISSGQANLLWSNAFLTLVNLVGIWRWLGRQARYEDGGRHAMAESAGAPVPTLFCASRLVGTPVLDAGGETVATVVDAMLGCDRHQLVYLVASRGGVGGIGETLHALDPRDLTLGEGSVATRLSAAEVARLPELPPDRWPGRAPLPSAA